MNSKKSELGFTLLEALAAIAVTAAVFVGLAALAGQWLPNWRHGYVALQNADLVGLALDRISEDVASAEYARLASGEGPPLFDGEPTSVTFVRQAIGPNAGPRLEVVRIGENSTRKGLEIQRTRGNFAPGAVVAFHDAATLLRSPFHLAFAYAGPDGKWVSTWNGSSKLPRAVRLDVKAAGGVVVASTAFALKVTAPSGAAPQSQSPTQSAPQLTDKSP